MILLIDNYDSFVYNLARYFTLLGHKTCVIRNTEIDAEGITTLQPEALVLSPGPCTPEQAGCSLEVVRRRHTQLPILGVCLGHQAIVQAFGGRVIRAVEPVHGRTSLVYHHGQGVFAGVPTPFRACRYHSLIAEKASLPDSLETLAWTEDGTIMAVAHRSLPVVGLQFHPEAILSEHGFLILANFLRLSGLKVRKKVEKLQG